MPLRRGLRNPGHHRGRVQPIVEIETLLKASYSVSKRMIALLILQEDVEILSTVKAKEKFFQKISEIIDNTRLKYQEPLRYVITLQRQQKVDEILSQVVISDEKPVPHLKTWLDRITSQPVTEIPILLLVLYFPFAFLAGYVLNRLLTTLGVPF